jgi:hypothetical protein
MEEQYEIYVGIDWGSETHRVCATDRQGKMIREWSVRHGGEELLGLAQELIGVAEQGQGRRVAVGIEVPRGAIVETLLERDIAVFATTRSSSIALETATRWREPRTTGETHLCLQTRSGRTARAFGEYA